MQGTYRSIEFVLVGPADGGVDVGAAGGHLTLYLMESGVFETHIWTPEPDGEPSRRFVTGSYRVSGGRVRFRPTTDGNALVWTNEATIQDGGGRLETADQPGHGAPFKIIVERTSMQCGGGVAGPED